MENRVDVLYSVLADFSWPIIGLAVLGVVIISIMKKAGAFSKFKEWVRHFFYIGIALLYSLLSSGVYLACIGKFAIDYFGICAAAIFVCCLFAYSFGKATSINAFIDKLVNLLLSKGNNIVKAIGNAIYTALSSIFATETAANTPSGEVPAETENPPDGAKESKNNVE